MWRAVDLARRGTYTCMPNPKVGCVIDQHGQIVGEGWHQQTGGAHAEVNALHAAGVKAKDATAYVTLEPCHHIGRTPPCTHALIYAGIKRIVVGAVDPNPKVSGKGIAALRSANIHVDVGLLEEAVHVMNAGFFQRMQTGRPLIRNKMAMSLDGRTAMASGVSQWITGREARADVQRLRGRSCAIMTGVGSGLKDNPSMTFRPSEAALSPEDITTERQPLRVMLDSHLRMPHNAVFFAAPGDILVVCCEMKSNHYRRFLAQIERVRADQPYKTEIIALPKKCGQRIDLSELCNVLGQYECNEVLLEAGATLSGAALQEKCVDELWLYIAPALLGSNACPLFDLPLEKLSDKIRLKIKKVSTIGEDWRFIATVIQR